MAVQGVERPPVVDETERLRGIVSRGDGDGFSRRDDAIRDEKTGDVLRREPGPASSGVTVEVWADPSRSKAGLIPGIERR
ncbi:hypothetical protein [Streptomyces mirabilis]|uniref:hypothetical protein n=1 Tax=Streptomyces mirabilis TaxID=68239 RepID=UPI0036AD9B53